MKLLTVAVPTYNTEKYLDRCLLSLLYDESILDQLEIIIVNDGSKDNSLAIARRYKNKFPNTIKVIDKINGGHGSTINTALGIATGKYFRVVDSDDWVNIIDFPKLFKDLEKYEVDIILTNYTRELVYEGSCVEFRYNDKIQYEKKYNLSDFDFQLFNDDYFFMSTSNIKTETLRKADFKLDEKTFYVDMEYVIFPIKEISSFVYLDYDIYRYFIGRGDQSISVQSMVKNRKDHEKVLLKLLHFYKDSKLSKNKHDYVKKILVLMLNSHYMVYCGSKTTNGLMVREIRGFDSLILENYPDLYQAVAKKFPYISYYRSTKFLFTKSFFAFYRKYVNHQLYKVGEKS